MKSNYKIMIFYAVLIAVILIATAALFGGTPGEKIMYSDIDKMFYEQQVKAFEIDSNDRLTIVKRDNTTVTPGSLKSTTSPSRWRYRGG